jgi:tetratricopeptide (TPR) repeat protein
MISPVLAVSVFLTVTLNHTIISYEMGEGIIRYQEPESKGEPVRVENLGDTARLNRIADSALKLTGTKETTSLAIPLIKEGFDMAKKKRLAVPYKLYWANAEIYAARKNYEKALKEIETADRILKDTERYMDIAKVSNFKAYMLLWNGRFSEAIDLFQSTVRLIRQNKLKGLLPLTYRGLADAFKTAGKTEEEKKYTELMLESSLAENDSDNQSRAYFRLGEITIRADSNIPLSNEYYKEAYRIREQRKDSVLFGTILNRICWNYYLMKQPDTALKYYNKLAEISIRLQDYYLLANAFANIGTIYRDKKEYAKALFFYGKSTAYSMAVKDWYNLSWMNKDMSDMYIQKGDFKKAYECYVAYKNYSDSLSMQKSQMALAEARLRYETDTKAKELEMVSLKLDKQRYLTLALAGGILLILLVAFVFLRQARSNARRRISEMNQKISEITQANLRQQMNPHFIFNTLNSIQYYMYQHDKIATNNYMTKFSSLMRKTLENSQYTSVSIRDELDALRLYLELETLRFKEKFDYSIRVDEEIDTLMYKIPTMLIQPYVENAICHGLINKAEKGYVNIDLRLQPDHILCIIEDNGIGREAAMEIKQKKEENHSSLGTRITESRLQLVNSLYGTSMKIHYTDLKDNQGNPSGTQVEIQIPFMT